MYGNYKTIEFSPSFSEEVSTTCQDTSKKIICVMPCYNAEKTLKLAIESIINQSYPNWELIIVDDNSTDKSYKIASSYKNHPQITVIKNAKNKGCYYSRNRGLYSVKDKPWDYFTIHDADDTSTHDRFAIYVNTLNKQGCELLVGAYNGKRWAYDGDGNPFLKFNRAHSSQGTSWYTKSTFLTFGYFLNTRFGGDSEYKERCLGFISAIHPKEEFNTIAPQVVKFMNKKYAYTYTTGDPNHLPEGLTVKYKLKEREEFAKECVNNILSFTKPKDFYYEFTPELKDL